MTQNEIAYRSMLLQHRRETERNAETARSNRMNEELKQAQNKETHRSNLVDEAERERTNRANEVIKHVQNAETERTNRANEVIQQVRNNETERSNRANEVIKQVQNYETERSNRAKEYENRRHNVATESETHRSNVAQETQQRDYQTGQLTESARHNKAQEDQALRNSAIDLVRVYGTHTVEGELGGNIGVAKIGGEYHNSGPNLTYEEAVKALSGDRLYAILDSSAEVVNNMGGSDPDNLSGFTMMLGTLPDGTLPNKGEVFMLNPMTNRIAIYNSKTGKFIAFAN